MKEIRSCALAVPVSPPVFILAENSIVYCCLNRHMQLKKSSTHFQNIKSTSFFDEVLALLPIQMAYIYTSDIHEILQDPALLRVLSNIYIPKVTS